MWRDFGNLQINVSLLLGDISRLLRPFQFHPKITNDLTLLFDS